MKTPEEIEIDDRAEMIAELLTITMMRSLYSKEELAQEKLKFDAKWAKYGPFGEAEKQKGQPPG